jgi:hypothetical protein
VRRFWAFGGQPSPTNANLRYLPESGRVVRVLDAATASRQSTNQWTERDEFRCPSFNPVERVC